MNTYVASQGPIPAHAYTTTIGTPTDYYHARTVDIPVLGNISLNCSLRTPNIYSNWFGPVTSSNTAVVNFNNVNDFALNDGHWQLDELLKPDKFASLPPVYKTTGGARYFFTGRLCPESFAHWV